MLVIADQRARGIGRKRRLAGAGQAEEDRGAPVPADIGRAMHRHHALGRQQVVQHAEHRFLHLAGISGAADQDQLLRHADRDHRLAAAAVPLGIGAEARQVDDRELRREAFELGRFRAHQQGADEQIVPGQLVDHPHVDAVLGLRAAIEVGDEQRFLARQRGQEIGLERSEMLRLHRLVVVPPDGVLGLAVADQELVLGGAAGVLAGLDHERPVLCELALAAGHGLLDQRGPCPGSSEGPRRSRYPAAQDPVRARDWPICFSLQY
jgi:hypothetical protein